MIIELNNNNCKEYTDEEFLAKAQELNREKEASELDWLFEGGKEERLEIERKIKEEEKEAEEHIKEVEALIEELKNNIKEEEDEYKVWENKSYKKTKGTAFVGDEIGGNNYTYYSLNMKRRRKRMNSALLNIEEYTKELNNKVKYLENLNK